MPEIEREKLKAMLLESPEDQRENLLVRLKERGYTLPGSSVHPTIGHPPSTQIAPPGAPIARPPNEPGLEERVPFLDSINLGLGALAEKSKETRVSQGGVPAPLGAAMKIGELGMHGLQGFSPSSPLEVGATLLAGPVGSEAIGVGKAVAKPVISKTGDVLAELAATWTGRTPEAFKALFKNPKIMAKVTELVGQAEQSKFIQAVEKSLSRLGEKYQAVQDALAGFGGQPGRTAAGQFRVKAPVSFKELANDTAQELVASGHRVPKKLSGLAELPEGVFSVDSPEYRSVTGWLRKLKSKPQRDFGEALNLRRQLDQEINYGPAGGQGIRLNDRANGVLKRIRAKLDEALSEALPPRERAQWQEANRVYAEASKAKAELRRQVAGETPEQTAARVLRQIKTGRAEENLTGKAVKLGDEAVQALDEIHDRVVASQFKALVSGHGGGAIGVATTTSPRLMGHLTALSGRAYPELERIAQALLAHPKTLSIALQSLINRFGKKDTEGSF